mgnify:CR=1 FL=1
MSQGNNLKKFFLGTGLPKDYHIPEIVDDKTATLMINKFKNFSGTLSQFLGTFQKNDNITSDARNNFEKYAQSVDKASMSTEDFIQFSTKLNTNAIKLQSSFGVNGLVGTIKNLGMSFLSAGANTAVAYVAMLGLQKAGEAIYNYFHKSELIIEKGQEAQKAIDEINQNKESTSSLVKDSGSTYAKLREKVGDLSAYSYLRDFFALKKE